MHNSNLGIGCVWAGDFNGLDIREEEKMKKIILISLIAAFILGYQIGIKAYSPIRKLTSTNLYMMYEKINEIINHINGENN